MINRLLRPHGWLHRITWWLVMISALLIAGYALGYVMAGERMFVAPLADSFRARPWGIYPHAFFGMIALAIGPFQFLRSLLRRRRVLHRTLGKIYVLTGLLTGAFGLYMAFYSFGGWITHLGFGCMAAAMLFTTATAYRKIRAGEIAAHRAWMIRSYALLFSAVTLRIWLPILVGAYEGAFLPAYQWVSWLSWVPNLLWAEWYVRRSPLPEIGRFREPA